MSKHVGEFNSRIYFLLISFLIIIALIILLVGLLSIDYIENPSHNYAILCLLSVLGIWFIFNRLKKKTAKINIDVDQSKITIKPFFGIAHSKSYDFREFDNMKIMIKGSRGDDETLCLIKDNKEVVYLSSSNYKNYAKLRNAIKQNYDTFLN